MTQEEKDLLLKDLSARLPYKVIVDYSYNAFDVHNGNYVKHGSKYILKCYLLDVFMSPRQNEKGEYIKPYLFPMSSMTIKQKTEFNMQSLELQLKFINNEIMFEKVMEFKLDFYNKHHLDWRGLIEKGLALDATNKKIY